MTFAKSTGYVALIAATALLANPAAATAISGLYSTGVDNGGTAVVGDVADAHWLLNGESPAFTSVDNVNFPIPYWLSDTATSRWITPSLNASDSYDPLTDGFYTYQTVFSLNAGDAANATFSGRFLADNEAVVTLNGFVLSSGGTFNSWTPFNAPSADFVDGSNFVTVTVHNYAQSGGNPTGLNLQFLTSNIGAVPEPATWALMLSGFGLAGVALRRRTASKSQFV
jgi:hypothetical protein